jgi:hypothetical protein
MSHRVLPLFVATATFLTGSLSVQALDFYSTGPGAGVADQLDDVWQTKYNAWGLSATADTDADGCINSIEAVAGTNPRNAQDCFIVNSTAMAAGQMLLTFKAEAGKRYRVISDSTVTGGFTTVETLGGAQSGTEFLATTSGTQVLSVAQAGPVKFYRVEAADVDTDGDGASDWDERQLGTNTLLPSSTGNGASDGETLRSIMSLTTTVTAQKAFERVDKTAPTPQSSPASVSLVREYGTMALSGLTVTTQPGAPTANNSNATAGLDFTVASTLTIPANQGVAGSPFVLNVNPVPDAEEEVPEYFKLRVQRPGAILAQVDTTLCVCDSDPALSVNNQLYVAYLNRQFFSQCIHCF